MTTTTPPDHILIVDDDAGIRELAAEYLQRQGLQVSVAADGRQMREVLATQRIDLLVLDLMLPGTDGIALCRELRSPGTPPLPIIMLTARSDEADRILGLELGADDYLTKPFAARELLARIHAVLRRTRMLPPNLAVAEPARHLAFGDWRLDTTARHLLDATGAVVALSGAEYRLLRVLLDHPQRILTRDQLLQLTQGRDADVFDRSIDLLVSRVRQRLGDRAQRGLCVLRRRIARTGNRTRAGRSRRMTLRWWPRSLFGRILLVLALGLALAHALTFVLAITERSMTMRRAMVSYLASDVASSMAMLDRLPAAERAQWVDRLARRNYRFALTAPLDAPEDPSDLARLIAGAVGATLPPGQTVRVIDPHVPGTELRLQLQLADGTPLAVDMDEPRLQVSPWVLGALALQLALLVGLCAWAVRAATRPLRTLADAADALGADRAAVPLAEDGPREVQRAAQAFNRMQQRIQAHLEERMRILAAVSHDLQTPITRLRLRADLLDDTALQGKLHADLAEMQSLVEEGIAYARSSQAVREPPQRVDLRALVESIARDYADAGLPVQVLQAVDVTCDTRPQALRRLLCNLVDNALKFAGAAELTLEAPRPGQWLVRVLDYGPGIPPADLAAVLQPYVRLEDSRNRGTGGTGLGLAIASELAKALGGRLVLGPRMDGAQGLEARVELPEVLPA